jgi:hypothetical protein
MTFYIPDFQLFETALTLGRYSTVRFRTYHLLIVNYFTYYDSKDKDFKKKKTKVKKFCGRVCFG